MIPMVVTAMHGCSAVTREGREFQRKLATVSVGMAETDVVRRLGPPHDRGTRFYLGQPDGFEKEYREAAESASVRFLFWNTDIDVVCAVGFDVQDQVAYKACGGT
jgi:hypothetical protein